MKNTSENSIFAIVDEEKVLEVLKKIRKCFFNYFVQFSAIMGVLFSIALWITKSLGYFYMLGRFSIYNIDKSYIDVWSEGFLVQVIHSASICIVLILGNYTYFRLSISRKRNGLKVIGLLVGELLLLNLWVIYVNNIHLIELFRAFKSASTTKTVGLILMWTVILIMINILGMEAAFFYKRRSETDKGHEEKKKDEMGEGHNEANNVEQKGKRLRCGLMVLGALLLTCIAEFILMYLVGRETERQRNGFKVVIEETEIGEDNEYLYPVIYENQDIYILSRIYKNGNVLEIDTSFLKEIDKKGVSTYYISNLSIEGF